MKLTRTCLAWDTAITCSFLCLFLLLCLSSSRAEQPSHNSALLIPLQVPFQPLSLTLCRVRRKGNEKISLYPLLLSTCKPKGDEEGKPVPTLPQAAVSLQHHSEGWEKQAQAHSPAWTLWYQLSLISTRRCTSSEQHHAGKRQEPRASCIPFPLALAKGEHLSYTRELLATLSVVEPLDGSIQSYSQVHLLRQKAEHGSKAGNSLQGLMAS